MKSKSELQEEIKTLQAELKRDSAKITKMKGKPGDTGVDGKVIEGGLPGTEHHKELEALNKAEQEREEAQKKITKLKNQLDKLIAEEAQASRSPTPKSTAFGVLSPAVQKDRGCSFSAYNAFVNEGALLDAVGLADKINANQASRQYSFSASDSKKLRATYNEHELYFNVDKSNNSTSITVVDDNELMDDVKLSNIAAATMEAMAPIIRPVNGRKIVEVTLGGTPDRQEAIVREYFKAAFKQGLYPQIDEKSYPHFDPKRQDQLRSEAKREAELSSKSSRRT